MASFTVTLPQEYLGEVIKLCEANRGIQRELTFFTATQVILKYDLPLSHLVDDFFGKLKGSTKGYASLDYEDAGFHKSSITKLNLLVNGAGGIAVGMATNIPPHNLGEVVDACLAYVDNPEIGLDELLDIVPGPDFPTGGEIIGRTGARTALMTGRGSVIMRGTATI